jgi:hypothetical protein
MELELGSAKFPHGIFICDCILSSDTRMVSPCSGQLVETTSMFYPHWNKDYSIIAEFCHLPVQGVGRVPRILVGKVIHKFAAS